MHVVANDHPHPNYCLLKLTADQTLPEMLPGQFVEVLVEGSSTTFLRRPISVHFVDPQANELWLLIQLIGDGTRKLATLQAGDKLKCPAAVGQWFYHLRFAAAEPLSAGGRWCRNRSDALFGSLSEGTGNHPQLPVGSPFGRRPVAVGPLPRLGSRLSDYGRRIDG